MLGWFGHPNIFLFRQKNKKINNVMGHFGKKKKKKKKRSKWSNCHNLKVWGGGKVSHLKL
jgi:hypothetical protein